MRIPFLHARDWNVFTTSCCLAADSTDAGTALFPATAAFVDGMTLRECRHGSSWRVAVEKAVEHAACERDKKSPFSAAELRHHIFLLV